MTTKETESKCQFCGEDVHFSRTPADAGYAAFVHSSTNKTACAVRGERQVTALQYSGGPATNPRWFCYPDKDTPTVLVRVFDSVFAERLLPGESGWESYPDLMRLTHGAPTMEWCELRPSEAPGVAAAMGRAGAAGWARLGHE